MTNAILRSLHTKQFDSSARVFASPFARRRHYSLRLQILVCLLVFNCFIQSIHVLALKNNLTFTPPMGWSSWNTLRCDFNESDIRQIADVMVSSGLKDAGYVYLNVDDCWQANARDANGNLAWNATKFPSGGKGLADYIHSKGLKFGLYSSSGPYSCQGFPGSWQHEKQDALQFAKWEVDFLKLDACSQFTVQDRAVAFEAMSQGLLQSSRSIVYSCDSDELVLKENNLEFPAVWAPDVCNIARIHWDIYDAWLSILNILTAAQNVGQSSEPGYFNDLDGLIVGMGSLNDTEYITHFQMWCIFSSSLIAGNDIRNMSAATLATLTNKEAISINQDPLGRAANLIRRSDDGRSEVWAKPLFVSNYTQYTAYPLHCVVLFNRALSPQDVAVSFDDLFAHLGQNASAPTNWIASVRDVWNHKDLGNFTSFYNAAQIPPHGSVMLTITLISSKVLPPAHVEVAAQ